MFIRSCHRNEKQQQKNQFRTPAQVSMGLLIVIKNQEENVLEQLDRCILSGCF